MEEANKLELVAKIIMPEGTHPFNLDNLHGFIICSYAEKIIGEGQESDAHVKLVVGQYFQRPEGSADGFLEAHFLNDAFDHIREAIADRILSAIITIFARRQEEPESLYEAVTIVNMYDDKFGLEARARENGNNIQADLIAFMKSFSVEETTGEEPGIKQPPMPPLDS